MNEQQQVPLPKTTHRGIVEHFMRACMFYEAAVRQSDPQVQFRIYMAALYSCRAIAELMLEQAAPPRNELTIDRKGLDALLVAKLPYYKLIERIRIHDFHRFGLTPPIPGVTMMQGFGPVKLEASNGVAAVQQFADGPKNTCTGNSSVKGQRPLYSVDGTFYDEDTDAQVPLGKIIRDYALAVPAAVDEYEKHVKCPGSQPSGPPPGFFDGSAVSRSDESRPQT